MLLVIDVGNTNTVLGLYDDDKLIHDWRIRTEIDHTVDEYGHVDFQFISIQQNQNRATKGNKRYYYFLCCAAHAQYFGAGMYKIF